MAHVTGSGIADVAAAFVPFPFGMSSLPSLFDWRFAVDVGHFPALSSWISYWLFLSIQPHYFFFLRWIVIQRARPIWKEVRLRYPITLSQQMERYPLSLYWLSIGRLNDPHSHFFLPSTYNFCNIYSVQHKFLRTSIIIQTWKWIIIRERKKGIKAYRLFSEWLNNYNRWMFNRIIT